MRYYNTVALAKNSHFVVPYTSIYAVVLPYKETEEDKRKLKKKNRPFNDQWQNDFYFLAKDFLVPESKIVDIIYDVVKNAKPTDSNDKLNLRAMNKLHDII